MVVTSTRDLSFHWADYVVFGSVLVISAGIGVFAAIKHRRATAEQLLTGNRKLPLVPGGIKAVVWTDAFQVLVIFTGFLALMIKGADDAGGWGVVFHRAREGARFTWDLDLDPDPFVRHTFWTLVVGGTFTSLTVYASNQAMLQRYLSVRNINIARTTILLHLPISEVFLVIAMLSGLVMYASYYNCDPLKLGVVSKADQLMPLFVMETLGEYPGLPGLFVACVYSAALSTVSSGVNSLAAVTLEDFLRPWMDKLTEGRFSARLHTIMTITSALFYGLVTIGLAYLAGLMGSTVLQISLSIFGMVGGPLLGLLVVGIFLPCVNSWGAGIGLVCSLCVSLWVGVGAILYPAPRSTQLPPLNTEGCNVTGDVITNSTLTYTFLDSTVTESSLNWNYTTTNATSHSMDSALDHWYRLSYQHYSTLSLIVSIVVGISVSAVTGFNKNRVLDPRTYYDIFACCRRTRRNKTYANGLQDGLSSDGSEQDVLTTRL
nr:hypothetical protein BaRGS_011950 [Batillaria attramentaria]